MIRVLIVDDQSLQRMGTAMFLAAQEDMQVVGEAADGVQALAQARALSPDVILMDIRMPGMDGITAVRRILEAEGDAAPKVLLLTTFDLDDYVLAGLEAGAGGFLTKDAEPEALLLAIKAVAEGDAVIAPAATRRLLGRITADTPAPEPSPEAARAAQLVAKLTEREKEILAAIGRGLTNAEICSTLHLAESTVKNYVGRIFAKIGARDRVHAAITAFRAGLVTL